MHANKQILFLSLALAIGAISIYLYNTTRQIPAQEQKERRDGQKQQATVSLPPLPEKIFGLAGNIISKRARSLTFEINSLKDRIPINGSIPKEQRIVQINDDTNIKELTFLRTKIGSAPTEKIITLNDLRIGDQIIVTANENIKEKSEFIAAVIQKHVFK